MKKSLFVLSLVLILALSSLTAFADEIIINIDSSKVEFNESLGFPFLDENNRTQVPFRATLEKFGAKVDWNNESRIAIATKDEIIVEVPINENYIIKNGEKITVDTAARVVNGRTYLPIRAVIEAFGSEVQWDSKLNTVVLTTEPIDAKALYLAANEKSAKWDNFQMNSVINMSMDLPDDTGNYQPMNMNMKMDMTIFTNPFKIKMKSYLPLTGEISQPIMEMYMTLDKDTLTQYMGMTDENGEVQWIKQVMKNEMLSDLMKNDADTIKKNKEITEKYTKDLKYFGKYVEDGKSLLRLQYTVSGDIYKEVFEEYSNMLADPTNEEEAMLAEMMKSFATMDMGDLEYIIYIDEATGEMVRMEMDLGEMIASIMSGLTESLGDMPAEVTEVLKSLKASMQADVLNINSAKDFKIPQEALDAQDITEMLEDLEAKTVTE